MDESRLISQVAGRLIERFVTLDPGSVVRVVHEIHARYDGRPVREYIPLFVERHALAELTLLSENSDSCTVLSLGAAGWVKGRPSVSRLVSTG